MTIYSYVIEHDFGLAPNPFGKYCTLAVCKPKIRSSSKLQIGDWIVGTGSRAIEEETGQKVMGKLIYAMEVSERIPFDKYWHDPRFQYKKPIMNGPLVTMFGDNFYHKDDSGNWVQEDSAHSHIDSSTNKEHLNRDISGENVLISERFFYFGNNAKELPDYLTEVCHTGIGEKKVKADIAEKLLEWLLSNFDNGLHGDPISWQRFDQSKLFSTG